MSYRPNRPVGTSKAALAYQAIWDKLWGKEPIIASANGVTATKNADGVTEIAVARTWRAVASSGGMTYKGEWATDSVCDVQQIWTRGILGEFICVSLPPVGTAPETGAPYWHAWSYPPPGVWQ